MTPSDNYHGTTVADPYHWLEDLDSPETRQWVEAENALTFGLLEKLPERAPFRERLTALWDYARFGLPFKEGGKYFFTKNEGLQNQAVLYVKSSLEAEPRILLDPNSLSTDGTVALSTMSVSPDGRWLAYGVAAAGSDWTEIHVRDIETGKDTEELLKWIKFSGASWTKDGGGFFYSRYPGAKSQRW